MQDAPWAPVFNEQRFTMRSKRMAGDDSLYVDALATDPDFRRRGAARALLDHAERLAREGGLPAVSLDTAMNNEGARALYAATGFDEVAYRAPGRGLPGFVALLRLIDR